jgi:exodeoxyribonuclease VII small subunit
MEKKSFEALLSELSEIVKELESGNLSLENSVEKYKKGIALSMECKKRLEEAKQVVAVKMNESGETPFKA